MIRPILSALLCASLPPAYAERAPEAQFLQNTRQLTVDGKRSGEGYFSPDGKQLVFQSEREEGNPFYQIYRLDLESGDIHRISPGIGKTTCGYFQPGTDRIIFASTHEEPGVLEKQKAELDFRASGKQRRYAWDYDAAMEIYSAKADGTDLVNLTKAPGYDAEGAFSPDGKLIVFCSLRQAYERELSPEEKARLEKDPAWFGEIYVMHADGSNIRRLTHTPGYDGGPFFSADGQRIIWRRFDASGMNADIFTMNVDGTDVRRLTDFQSMSWAPYFHPSGEYAVFTSNKHGFENFELFIVDTAGRREPVRVTHTPGFDGLPVFSPDGRKLTWASGRTTDGKSQIFLADWNHAAALEALRTAKERTSTEVASQPVSLEPAKAGDTTLQPAITTEDIAAQVTHLASERFAGRGTGTEGVRLAADWIADTLRKTGIVPLPGFANFFHPFEFNAGERVIPERNILAVAGPENFAGTLDRDFRPLPFSTDAKVEGEVVFAGYGLNVPEGPGQRRYSSYDGLDIKDKIVLLLRYVPESVDPQRRAHLNRYAGIRYKVMMARERGAKGVLIVTGPNSPGAGELLPLSGDGTHADSGLPALSISGEFAKRLLASSGQSLAQLQTALDDENPHAPGGFTLPKLRITMQGGLEHIKKNDNNVIGYLPGTTDEWVLLGAHYDHLGSGKGTASLARSGEETRIHYGADDNASGTALVLEVAAALAAERAKDPTKFRRNIAFCFWSGEEIGLLGSSAFTEKPPFDLAKATAYLNADMVGRLRDNRLILQAVGSSKAWPRLIEKRNVAAGFNLTLQQDPYLPTDVTAFYPRRVPVLNFFTGSHEDYHRPTDTADKVNHEGIARIAQLAKYLVLDVASSQERIDFSRVERKEQGGSRDNLRAYLGSIPDYAQDTQGVKLSGVRAGSPAEKAGIQTGDIIVEFAGQKITNIYDYTYALDAVKIGVPVQIIVERKGQRVTLTATPEQRK